MLGPQRRIIWISIRHRGGIPGQLLAALPRLFTPVDSLQCSLLSTTDRADHHPLAIHTMTGSLTARLQDPQIPLGAVTLHPLPDASTLTTAVVAMRLPLQQSKIGSRLRANLTVLMTSPRLLPVLRLVGQPGTVGLLPVWRPRLVLRPLSQSQRIIVLLPVLPPLAPLRVRVHRWVSVVRRAVISVDPVVEGVSEVVASEEGLRGVFEAVGEEVVWRVVAECLLMAVEAVARVSIPGSHSMRMPACLRPVLAGLSPQQLLPEVVVGLPQSFVRGVTVPRLPTRARSASPPTDNRFRTAPPRLRLPAPAPAVVHPTPRAQAYPLPVPAPE